jgi:AcrR family transcriptional regulator
MAAETRERLRAAALRVLGREGISGVSARVIATEADANQALIFYHYGSVDGLLAEASQVVTTVRAQAYADRLTGAATFSELAAAARQLHREERENGNLAVLRQLVAGSQTRPELRPALQQNFALLLAPVERTLRRLLEGSVLEDVVDPADLASSVAGGFLGLQLLDDVVVDAEAGPFAALDALASVVDLVIDAGALETTLLRRRMRTIPRG